jgi:hypothetical protein
MGQTKYILSLREVDDMTGALRCDLHKSSEITAGSTARDNVLHHTGHCFSGHYRSTDQPINTQDGKQVFAISERYIYNRPHIFQVKRQGNVHPSQR